MNTHPASPIGVVKGPGETPHEFTLIAPDPQRIARHGEFVYYLAEVDDEERRILGRITQRASARAFPDAFLADPAVPPAQVAALFGYDGDDSELFELTITVIGYHDAGLGEFINPRVPPAGGSPVYLAEDEWLSGILGRRKPGARGAAHLGSLLSRAPQAVPIALDVAGFTSTHLAIIAGTGSGKSYLAAVLVVDPHGEYGTLQEMQNLPAFREGNYKPVVRIVQPDSIKVRYDSLSAADLRYLMPPLTDKMHPQFARAVSKAKAKYPRGYSLEHLLREVRFSSDSRRDAAEVSGEQEDEDPTTEGIIWRINSLRQSRIFNDIEDLELRTLFAPGRLTVMQLNEVDQREQQVIAAVLLRRIYQARVDTEKQKIARGDPNYIPFPVFCLIEEAHNFAPASADAVSTEQLKTILSEGRKFGVSVGLISQRPGKLDADVLSQCMTQCIMRIVNPIDQDRIASSVESVGRELIRELPSLSKGQVIVSGASINTPVLLRVRKRVTSHGGQSIDAPEQWQQWFDTDRAGAEARDDALTLDKRLVYEDDGNVLFYEEKKGKSTSGKQ